MRIGVPKEVKNNETRVAITEAGVFELTSRGHQVLIERGAGEGSAISDVNFEAAGATIVDSAVAVWQEAEMILKVKEPDPVEYGLMREGQILFSYLHLAASRECTNALISAGVTAIAYETVQLPNRVLPLLAPMSEVAGRLSVQIGAFQLLKPNGGRGVLLGGVTATRRGKVVVIGGGAAGEQAARTAHGLGAEVTVIDISLPRLKQLEDEMHGQIETRTSNSLNISTALLEADLVIGSVLIPGAKAPKLVTDEMVQQMKPGAVLVDIAIDQGGCFENSKPTTHDDPTFQVHDCIYYCVTNMPGAVPETSTNALTNATLPYVTAIADKGWVEAMRADESLAKGLNVHSGSVVNRGVAQTFADLPHRSVSDVLGLE